MQGAGWSVAATCGTSARLSGVAISPAAGAGRTFSGIVGVGLRALV
jgi:hypothetical protein